jgi:uncharacterized RDD family membrane protein YckC
MFPVRLWRSRSIQPAPLRRRFLAGLIDAPLWFSAFGALVGVAAWGLKRRAVEADQKARPERLLSNAVMYPITLLLNVLGVVLRLRRSPGQRVAGIRTVDAATSQPVTLRQAVLLAVVRHIQSWLQGRIVRRLVPRNEPVTSDSQRSMNDHSQALEELRRIHAGNREAYREAAAAYYRAQPRTWSWSAVLRPALAGAVLRLAVEGAVRRRWPGRSLAEVLAGTMVAEDR